MIRALLRTVAAVAVCMALATSAYAQPALTTVRVGFVPIDDATPLVYAIRSGMFRDVGLEVQLIPASGGAVIAAAVVSQAFDFGASSVSTIINAHLHDVPLAMVAAAALYDPKNPYGQFVVAVDSSYRTAMDMNGKTIGTATLNDFDSLAIQAWLDKNGGDSKSLRLVEIPQSAAAAAIAEHRIDGTVMRHPLLDDAIASGKVRAIYPIYNAIGGPSSTFVMGAYSTSKSYAEKHPDIVRKFVQVLYRSAAFTNTHPAATIQMMAEITKVSPATIERMYRVIASTSLSVANVQPVIDAAAKYGAIARAFPASDLLQYAPK